MAQVSIAGELSSDINSKFKCFKCQKKVANGVKCYGCDQPSHLKCANLEVKTVSTTSDGNLDSDKWACPACRPPQPILTDSHLLMSDGEVIAVRPEIEIIYLKQEVTLLKKLLSEMESNNKLLTEKVTRLESISHDSRPTYASTMTSNHQGKSTKPIELAASSNRSRNTVNKQASQVGRQHVPRATSQQDKHRSAGNDSSPAVGHEDNVERAMPHNKDSAHDTASDTGFKIVTHQKAPKLNQGNRKEINGNSIKPAQEVSQLGTSRREHRHRPTIATGSHDKYTALRAAERKVWIHLSRFTKTTKCEDILTFLKDEFPNQDSFSCDQITTRLGDYASFKVGAPYSLLEKLYNPELWPAGIAINRFFQRRQTQEIIP